MPKLLVLRLHPIEPTEGETFEDYLTGLTITVHDLAFVAPDDPDPAKRGKIEARLIGTARFLPRVHDPTPDDPVRWHYDPDTDIVQHYTPVVVDDEPTTAQSAVATAVIEIPDTDPDTRTEYETSDIRIEVERGGRTIVKSDLNFNVLENRSPKPPPSVFPNLSPVSLYISLPAPRDIDLDTSILELSEDGRPPNFSDLYDAVRAVLIEDPDIADTDDAIQAKLEILTREEARHIAYEIMYNPAVYPPPTPSCDLAELYTLDFPGRDKDDADQARAMFEAELSRYKAVRSAEAERVGNYVYALAAAFQCQKWSVDATEVGFTFPVDPEAPEDESASKARQVEVILKN
jgi:hypothetical protein